MVMLNRNTVVLGKIEATPNIDANPTGIDAIECFDVSVNEIVNTIDPNKYKSTIGASKPKPGLKEIEVSFSCYLKGSGTIDVAPEIGALLQACTMEETITPSTNVIYKPISTAMKTITIYVYKDSLELHKLIGGEGTFTIDAPVGELATIKFTFKGKTARTTGTAPACTYDTTEPNAVLNAAMQFFGFPAVCTKISIDVGNETTTRKDMNEVTGVKGYLVSKRKASGTADPEYDSTLALFDKLDAGTAGALTFDIGGTTGNKVNISAPVCVLTQAPYSTRDGIEAHDAQFILAENAGDDELVLTFS